MQPDDLFDRLAVGGALHFRHQRAWQAPERLVRRREDGSRSGNVRPGAFDQFGERVEATASRSSVPSSSAPAHGAEAAKSMNARAGDSSVTSDRECLGLHPPNGLVQRRERWLAVTLRLSVIRCIVFGRLIWRERPAPPFGRIFCGTACPQRRAGRMRQTFTPNSFSAFRNAIFSLASRGRSTVRNQSVPCFMSANG